MLRFLDRVGKGIPTARRDALYDEKGMLNLGANLGFRPVLLLFRITQWPVVLRMLLGLVKLLTLGAHLRRVFVCPQEAKSSQIRISSPCNKSDNI